MIDLIMYNLAVRVATNAHFQQFRDDGETPYITHPLAVADKFEDLEHKTVAVLHDVIEDTQTTGQELLLTWGFPQEVVDAVVAITHNKGETYGEYIKKVMKNKLARDVKIEDIKHNMSTLDEKTRFQSRVGKYELALIILEGDK